MTATTTSPPIDQAPATLAPTHRRRRRRLAGAAGLVLVVVLLAWVAGVFDTGHARSAGVSDNKYPTSSIYADIRIVRPVPIPRLCRHGRSGWSERPGLAGFLAGLAGPLVGIVSEALEEREGGVAGFVAAGRDVGRGDEREGFLLDREVGVEVGLGRADIRVA